jgi:hypothetical protein
MRPGLPAAPRVALISIALLIPCFWQEHIQCADLASHLYNAWLRTQVLAGHLPGHLSGLAVARQSTNFLVDDFLTYALRWWGPQWAERLLVGCSVLIFFWGTFRFLTVLTGRRPWHLSLLLAMLAYGVVFRWGFFNFYLSFGLCMWAAALTWSPRRAYRLLALIPYLLAITAHIMPPLWLAVVVLYLHLVERLAHSSRLWIFGTGLAAILVGHFALRYLLRCDWPGFSPVHVRRYADLIGLGQLTPYSKYFAVAVLLLLLWAPWIWRALRRLSLGYIALDVLAQLVLLNIVASLLAPEGVADLPGYRVGFSFIGIRLSLMTAVLVCALLARTNPPRWHTIALASITALFFSFAYVDEWAVNQAETRVREVVAKLPPGARVVLSVLDSPHGIAQIFHLLDRPCIGHCFDYANYEPSSGQFRLRATQPNPYVLSEPEDVAAVGQGTYVVKRTDTPLYRVVLADPAEFRLRAELVSPGQVLTAETISVEPAWWRSAVFR